MWQPFSVEFLFSRQRRPAFFSLRLFKDNLVGSQVGASNEGIRYAPRRLFDPIYHISLRVCQDLGADFRLKSEIRTPALWGRKAGTDRVFLFDSLRGRLADPRLRASNEGLFPSLHITSREWLGCPRLRASDEHSFIVRVLRARRAPGHSLPILLKLARCASTGSSQLPHLLF